ncbi:ParA family protein, partial [Enterococcus faecium]
GTTYQIASFDRSMSAAIKKGDWVTGITQVSPHLYIMAGTPGSEELNEYLSEKYPDRRKRSLALIKPLEELRKHFDYIFILSSPF